MYPTLIQDSSSSRRGFALILALTLMAFLLLLLVSLSTMTRMETQLGTIRSETTQARSNALLGLYAALAQLQKEAGPDQRVTATADLLDDDPAEGQRYWTGVWNTANIDRYSPYEEPTDVAWLVSGTDGAGNPLTPGATIDENAKVVLVSDASDSDNDVYAGKLEIESADGGAPVGHYAYWIGDEGVKAKVNLNDPYRNTGNELHRRYALQAAQRFGIESLSINDSGATIGEIEGFSVFDPAVEEKLERVVSSEEYGLLNENLSDLRRRHYHDITTSSYGVLANTRDGGLKRDLSLAFEMDLDDFNAIGVFAADGEDIPFGAGYPVNYLFKYTDFPGLSVREPVSVTPAARGPTWHLLRNYYRLYKNNDPDRFQGNKTGNPAGVQKTGDAYMIAARPAFPQRGNTPSSYYNSLSEAYYDASLNITVNENFMGTNSSDAVPIPRPTDMGITPILLRTQAYFSLRAIEDTPATTAEKAKYRLELVIDPVVTIWNPYNVALNIEEMRVSWLYFDLMFITSVFEPGEASPETYTTTLKEMYHNYQAQNSIIELNLLSGDDTGFTLQPGQTMVFTYNHGEDRSSVKRAYKYQGIMHPYATAENNPQRDDAFIFTKLSRPWGPDSAHGDNPGEELDGDNYNNIELLIDSDREISVSVRASNASLYVNTNLIRTIGGSEENTKTSINLLSSPLNNYKFVWPSEAEGDYRPIIDLIPSGSLATGDLKYLFGYMDTYLKPANTPNPVQFLTHYNPRASAARPSAGSEDRQQGRNVVGNWYYDIGPQADWSNITLPIAGDGSGYWGWSNNSGATRQVAFEIPTSPLLSLASFQHVNNVTNYAQQPASPIGNAYASPFIPRTNVTRTITDDGNDYTQIDWSYMSNEALWDDYFFSSLAPRLDKSPEVDDMLKVITDFVYDGETLPNSRLRLHLNGEEDHDDVGLKLIDDGTTSKVSASAYARSAENLIVDGAFNVNSTSVEAWKALLHATNDIDVDYVTGSNNLVTETNTGAVYSRMMLPGEDADVSDRASRWAGYRALTDGQIDVLAAQIVEEVKTRGPFISLSDFVNRRLANDATGLKGTLQAAIDRTDINDEFSNPVSSGDLSTYNLGYTDHAVGEAASGAPGFLRQADLLTTLGPTLTARSDTFVIRAYGDYVNPFTSQKSEALCEAIVQRTPEYVDMNDIASKRDTSGDHLSETNLDLGRRFKIVSFRWLDSSEI